MQLIEDEDIKNHLVPVTTIKPESREKEDFTKAMEKAKSVKGTVISKVDNDGIHVSKPDETLQYMMDYGMLSFGEIQRAVRPKWKGKGKDRGKK